MRVNAIPMTAPVQKNAAVQRKDNVAVQAHEQKAAPAKLANKNVGQKLNKIG